MLLLHCVYNMHNLLMRCFTSAHPITMRMTWINNRMMLSRYLITENEMNETDLTLKSNQPKVTILLYVLVI